MNALHGLTRRRASPARQSEILSAFADAGAKLAIADGEPRWAAISAASAGNWQRLGGMDFYAYRLPRRENTALRDESSNEPGKVSR